MAKGDIINGILAASGNFQPASGVEIILTHLTETGSGDSWHMFDGSNDPRLRDANLPSQVVKVGITNSIYLKYGKTTLSGGYTGVQVK